MRFTPTDYPKKPISGDSSKTIHVKFDDDEPIPKVGSNKRSIGDQASNQLDKRQKTKKGSAPVKPAATKPTRTATKIDTPGAQVSKPKPKPKTNNKRPGTAGPAKKKTMTLDQVRSIREKKRERRRAQTKVGDVKLHVPELKLNTTGLKSHLRIDGIRDFALYALADAPMPNFARIINRGSLQHVVFLYAPGLDSAHFGLPKHDNYDLDSTPAVIELKKTPTSTMARQTMPHFYKVFEHMFLSALPAKRQKVGTEFMSFLQCPVSVNEKKKREEQDKQRMEKHKNQVEQYYMFTLEELRERRYPVPTFLDPSSKLPDDEWKETRPAVVPSERKRLIAVDCEMVKTASGPALARATLVDENGETLLDQLVKPSEPVLDYVTQYSGITEEVLRDVTCSLRRVQKYVRRLVDHNVILVGHGLENDLKALKIAHPYCADTAVLYDSFFGPPHKPSLRQLSAKVLKRTIQHHGKEVGHDSAEDARAALDLFKRKVEEGPLFGKTSIHTELIFNRLNQVTPKRTSALLERSEVPNYLMSNMYPADYHCCATDEELVKETVNASKKYNLVVSQFRTLIPWAHLDQAEVPAVLASESVADGRASAERMVLFDRYFQEMYDAFPDGTLVFVMGGYGGIDDGFQRLFAQYKRACKLGPDSEKAWPAEDKERILKLITKARLGANFCALKGFK